MYVSIYFVRGLVAEIRRAGVRESTYLEQAGITREELADPTLRLPSDRYEAAVRAARSILGDEPGAGLRVGESWPMTGYLLAHLFCNAASLRESVELVVRYRRLVHESIRLRLVERGDVATLVYENPARHEDNARFESEAMLLFLLRMGRFLVSREGPPAEITFTMSAPLDESPYVRAFGIAPVFDTDRDSISFTASLLDVPNINHDPGLGALLEQRADEVLASLDDDARIVGRVRDLLRQAGDPAKIAVEDLASRVGTSVRVLQRKLRSRGTTVSELIDDARRSIAVDAIANGSMPIKEIADRLGFSEPSAFHRAFKRWTGNTPSDLREKRRSVPPEPA